MVWIQITFHIFLSYYAVLSKSAIHFLNAYCINRKSDLGRRKFRISHIVVWLQRARDFHFCIFNQKILKRYITWLLLFKTWQTFIRVSLMPLHVTLLKTNFKHKTWPKQTYSRRFIGHKVFSVLQNLCKKNSYIRNINISNYNHILDVPCTCW